ncbi:predicted protein [Fibroporia radiculosa]|uniref:Uncharacterized protein n=1 Tax=Fibroporia radiculosa TaxID=599839 RepID=J7RVW6_9APHY|nr:predicted protein [Fibroporia radiculosa]
MMMVVKNKRLFGVVCKAE